MKITNLRLLPPALLLTVLCAPLLPAQTPAAAPPPPQPSPSASTILNPAISTLQQTLGSLRLDKWKTTAAARQETEANISSIYHDLEATLPGLLTTADQAPDSVANVLPTFRNIEALYDVLLRIVQVSRLSAPPQQSAALEQALTSLEGGRRSLGDQIQSSALTQDKQVRDLQAALRTPPPAPAPVPCTPPPPSQPAKKRKPRPATTTPAPAASQTTKPPSQ